ncbi:MAG: universal stress protein [Rhodospirillales bacterium]|nr:universal stress protein [Rhodospirillales bacterium]
MRRFQNILFIANHGADKHGLVGRAARLATVNKARLTLFDALDLEDESRSGPATQSAVQELNQVQVETRLNELEELRDSIGADFPDLDIGVDVGVGELATTAIRAVLSEQYDLVMKMPEGSASPLRVLFGSSDQKLMRKCPCPVWIIKPSENEHFKRILAAVNMNHTVPESKPLTQLIMALGTSLAADEQCELHVLHAWQLAGEVKLRGRQIHVRKVEQILKDMEGAHKSELEALLEDFPYERRDVHLVKGSAAEIIPKFVEEREIDLVVIGTVGRSGIPGLLIGNTAERVLNAVDCSVLTVKPEGFETPIEAAAWT